MAGATSPPSDPPYGETVGIAHISELEKYDWQTNERRNIAMRKFANPITGDPGATRRHWGRCGVVWGCFALACGLAP